MCSGGAVALQRIDLERQAVDPADYYELSGGQAEDATASQSSPWTKTLPCGESAVCATPVSPDQTLRSGDHFVAPRFESDRHEEGGDQAEAEC